MAASVVTVTASFTSGSGIVMSACLTSRNPGSAAMIAPNPYSDAVFSAASNAPPTATFEPSMKRRATVRNASSSTVPMPHNNAP